MDMRLDNSHAVAGLGGVEASEAGEMACYDALPSSVRCALQLAPCNLSAVQTWLLWIDYLDECVVLNAIAKSIQAYHRGLANERKQKTAP